MTNLGQDWLCGGRGMTKVGQERVCSERGIQFWQHLTLPGSQAFCMASADIINALREESSDTKQVIFNKTYFTLLDRDEKFRGFPLFHLKDYEEGAEMWILDDPKFPLIVKMLNNPVEINWTIE